MGSGVGFLLRVVLAASVLLAVMSVACAGGKYQLGLGLEGQLAGWVSARSSCTGTVAECLAEDEDEFSLDSESNRRILAASGYISYAALRRGSVPCSRRGASYYNCRPGAQANPYRRGCNAITRCRS
ncbi:unnamed protein product [Spirodela intermedia]|uniref:Uncharacterized protein n=1 Tax=Spirodela intermedia TaxID=51605 RepID=A0A7I8KRH4_SPIIN|nr:unnamed protein product [Spirodela intermedia]